MGGIELKKIITLVISLIISLNIFLISDVVQASDGDIVVSLTLDNSVMQVNGKNTRIDPEGDTAPAIVNNRVLVPIRAIVEAFGGTVGWDGNTQSVLLEMDDTEIRLNVGNDTAYINGKAYQLDAAPDVINQRTMLPVRFVAEGFNLGVAWEQDARRVTIIKNTFTEDEYTRLMKMLPSYSESQYVIVNNNKPFFKDYEIIEGSFEYYSDLDELGRCGVCMASVGDDLMPTEKRESISSVKPTGWVNKQYDWVSGGYLYNRCHLIGFQLTGENANERNLITGTRSMNVNGMLPFENMVANYVEQTDNNAVYRVTPVFTGDNLVADGVLLEGYFIGDGDNSYCFCIFCYNTERDIVIDYKTGDNHAVWDDPKYKELSEDEEQYETGDVYRTPSGKRYHIDANCGGKNSYSVTLDDAVKAGLTPCAKCVK